MRTGRAGRRLKLRDLRTERLQNGQNLLQDWIKIGRSWCRHFGDTSKNRNLLSWQVRGDHAAVYRADGVHQLSEPLREVPERGIAGRHRNLIGYWTRNRQIHEFPAHRALAIDAERARRAGREVDAGMIGLSAAAVDAGFRLRAGPGLPIGIVGVPRSDIHDVADDGFVGVQDPDLRPRARETRRKRDAELVIVDQVAIIGARILVGGPPPTRSP